MLFVVISDIFLVIVIEPEGKRSHKKIMRRQKNNININLKEIRCGVCKFD
jgi:hypothetical protein